MLMDSITIGMSSTGKKKKDNITKWTIAAALYIVGWSVTFFVSWCVFREEPGILEGCILAPGVVELVMSAVLKLGKNNKEVKEQTIANLNTESEGDSSDFNYYG